MNAPPLHMVMHLNEGLGCVHANCDVRATALVRNGACNWRWECPRHLLASMAFRWVKPEYQHLNLLTICDGTSTGVWNITEGRWI